MRRFVGKAKPKTPPPTLGAASERLGGRSDTIDQKIAKLDRELAGYKKQIKSTNSPAVKQQVKKRAIQVLKRKKMYEQQRDQLGAQQFNIDQQAFALEGMQETSEMVKTLKASAKQMKQEYKKINIDKIEDLQDDLADLMVDAEEVQEVMSREYGTPLDIDEADLDAELEGLDDFDFEEDDVAESSAADAVPDYLKPSAMPAVPSRRVAVPAGGDDTDEYGLPKQRVATQM
jgi:charged multivesicular body protein 5